MKKGDKVREIGDTLIGTIIKIKHERADVKFSKLKAVYSLPLQFLEKVRGVNHLLIQNLISFIQSLTRFSK